MAEPRGWRFVISIHALREEGDLKIAVGLAVQAHYFYPRPPRGGRLIGFVHAEHVQHISIHALREEGDTSRLPQTYTEYIFLSTPSARRATVAG